MAQHDYVIANGTGAAVRSDLNNALAAIVSNNSGATEPATMYAYQWWADTTTGLLKLRNAANNAWITLRELDGTLTIEDGTASSPGLAFADDLNTGIYSPSADQLGITTGGTVRLTTTTTGITSALPVDVPLGTASAPTVTFTGDLNTGIYSPGADQVAISTGGSGRLFVDSSGNVTINGQGDLRFADSDSSNWVAFQAPATVASNVTWTLPAADGTSAQVLSTNGSGTLSWASVSSDKISEGNTEAEVVDTGSDGHFKVTTEGSERLRVDPSGRLLVGTSTARDKFFNAASGENPLVQFEGAGVTAQGLYMLSLTANNTSSSSGAGASLILARSGGTSVGSYTTVSDGQSLGRISFQGADGSELVEGASISALADGGVGANDLPTRLVFSTTADGASSPTERMRIAQNGFTTLITTNDVFFASTTQGAGTAYEFFRGLHSGTAGTGNSGTVAIRIYSNGNIQNTNGSYGTLSDAKLKENIVDAGSQWDDLKAIRIRKWNFKPETGHETHRQIGPIAQELEQVCPGLVFETPDRDEDGNETGEVTKGVNQSVLYMKAVKALQEAIERIETLEAKVAALEAA